MDDSVEILTKLRISLTTKSIFFRMRSCRREPRKLNRCSVFRVIVSFIISILVSCAALDCRNGNGNTSRGSGITRFQKRMHSINGSSVMPSQNEMVAGGRRGRSRKVQVQTISQPTNEEKECLQ
ncbi:uncharacterized protein [Macrobrachium rosenbergii]|uniref:uncharacterized protein n=1 Tax=Macrobrachium rosenbergii TaxID=79674 RepID=UPI0034D63228